jgi:hypothetical protein
MPLATISGTALVPGVSRNNRYFSPELIGKAVTRAQARLADGLMPMTMRVSHPVDEPRADVTEIVGRITKLWQESDGRARYEAVVADTPPARNVLALIDNREGQTPYLRGVSIRGDWIGTPRKVHAPGGAFAETADDMEIDGLDFTHRPGVTGAAVEHVYDPEPPNESAPEGRTRIYESVQEALVVTAITEADAPAGAKSKAPYGPVKYADPGYQSDKQKRYPVDTLEHAKAAWSYVNQGDNAAKYTAPQLKRVRARIVAVLKKFGVDVDIKESLLIEHRTIAESGPVTEGYPMPAGMEICLDNGMVTVRVCSYSVDPADLDIVARQAMAGACAALALIDPDDDGDIDVPDEDEGYPTLEPVAQALSAAFETAPPGNVTEAADPVDPVAVDPAPEPVAPPPAPSPAADPITPEEVPAVSEESTTAAVASSPAPAVTFTDEQFKAFLAAVAPPPVAVAAPAEAAPAAPVAEAAPGAVTESEEARIERIVNARLTEAMQRQVVQTGPPARKGLVGRVTESGELRTAAAADAVNSNGLPADWPDKPLHQYKDAERGLMSAALLEYVTGPRPQR